MTARKATTMRLLAAVWLAKTAIALFGPSPAYAWGYPEHELLGRTAYVSACRELYAARGFSLEQRQRLDMACKQLDLLSQQYGQFCALSGDHLDAHNTQGHSAHVAAKNLVEYLLRGVKDADHFHPEAPRVWHDYHGRALQKAMQAAKAPYLEQIKGFWEAFYLNAYGDHFLQDSFSTGHSGFNRPDSPPSASFQTHKDRNAQGRIFRDGAGRVWLAYGDNRLDLPANRGGKERVQLAATGSVRSLLMAFATGRRSRAHEREVSLRFPVWSRPICPTHEASSDWDTLNRAVDHGFATARELEQGYRVDQRAEPPADLHAAVTQAARVPAQCPGWLSLILVHEPAHYDVTHTLGVFNVGRVAPFEALFGAAYWMNLRLRAGIRLGLEAGWYSSTRGDNTIGVLLAPVVTLPLGDKYGTVLAWDLDARAAGLFPVASYRGTELVQHWAFDLDLGMSVQLGVLNFRFALGPAAIYSDRLGPGPDDWGGWGFGWHGSVGVQFLAGPAGGGRMEEPWL